MAGLDVSGYLDDGSLTLDGVASKRYPEGRSYKVASLSWPDTLRLRRLVGKWGVNVPGRDAMSAEDAADLAALVTRDDGTEMPLTERLLGDAYAEMVDDGVPPINVDRISTVVTIHFGTNEVVAAQFVAAASGEARARANRATPTPARKQPAKRASSPNKGGSRSSRASGAASTPRSKVPASTHGPDASTSPAKTTSRRAVS